MLDELKSWLGVISTALGIGAIFYTWLTARASANGKTLEGHGKTLIDHDRRIQSVESELKHLPDKDTVTELKLAIAELKGTVGRLDEQLGSVGRTVHRIDDYLRKDDKK